MVLAKPSAPASASGSARKSGNKPDYSVKLRIKDSKEYQALTGLFFKPFRNGSKAWSGKDKNTGITYSMTTDRENNLVLKCRQGEQSLQLICALKEVTKDGKTFHVGESEDGNSYFVFRRD
jgi:hypothetical protein